MVFLGIALVLIVLCGGFGYTSIGTPYRSYSNGGAGTILGILLILWLVGILRP